MFQSTEKDKEDSPLTLGDSHYSGLESENQALPYGFLMYVLRINSFHFFRCISVLTFLCSLCVCQAVWIPASFWLLGFRLIRETEFRNRPDSATATAAAQCALFSPCFLLCIF